MKTKHDKFKYFVTCDAEGGREQETGKTVRAFDSLDKAIEYVSEPLEYVFDEGKDEQVEAIKSFKPGSEPAVVYEFTLENGGEEDDWLYEEYTIVYTNKWEERIEYEI